MIKLLRHYFVSLSLRTQLLMMAFFLALPSIALIILLGIEQRKYSLEEGISESRHLADRIASEQYNLVGDAEQLLSVLAQLPAIRGKNVAATTTILAEILKKNQQYGNIIATDHDGVVWASALSTTKTFSLRSTRSIGNALTTKHFSSGEYTVGKISAKRTIGFSYPFLKANGDVDGVIAVNFNFDKVNELFAKEKLPPDTTFTIVDHKGTIIDRNLDQEKLVGKQDRDEIFQRMKNGPVEDSFIETGLSGNKRLISYRKLQLQAEASPYLYVRISIPYEGVLLIAQKSQIKYMAFLFPFLFAVVMLVLTIGKRCFVIPINKLEEASRYMAEGSLDVKVSDFVEGGELKRLGQTFDRMACQLAEREQALRKSESEYRFLTENSADIIWRLDADRRITYINPADEHLRGFSKGEVLGKRLIDLMPPEDAEHLTEIDSERHAEEKAGVVTGLKCFETYMYCKNGEMICVEVLSAPIRDENGNLVGSHGVARDISRRKRIEEERETLIGQLQNALSEIKKLSGMLPICCSCKKIRDDKGYWNQLESYISDHSDVMFSHSYCPECAEKFYEEIDKMNSDRIKQGNSGSSEL